MELSIVTTLYRSKPFLPAFFEQITNEVKKLGVADYEIVVVNDGSPDDSLEYCIEAKKDYPQICIIDLSRNFGHHYAIQAGLSFASGDYVYLVDNDMETPISFLSDCYKEIKADSSLDQVYGVQVAERKGGFVERVGGSVFWKMFNKLAESDMPVNVTTESIYTKRFIQEFTRMNDSSLFLCGMIHWMGFNKKELKVLKTQRQGKSTYNIGRRFALMVNAITSSSGKPLEYLFYTGIYITLFSVLFLLYIFVRKLLYGNAISLGWTSIIGINVLGIGLLSTFLGLIGLYVFRIYKQVQGRPNVYIKKIYK